MRLLTSLLALGLLFSSHDMFLRVDSHFLPAESPVGVALYNGTFEASDNTIARDRMLDVSLVAGGGRSRLDTTLWRDEGETSYLDMVTGAPGTYVLGVSTRARNIEMAADDFNGYLEHDGVVDMLQARTDGGLLGEDAVERYSKHVKAVFQVGDERTGDWETKLGYPIEFTPLSNPYTARPGDALRVLLERDGRPLANQLVYAGAAAAPHAHDHDHDHAHGDDEHEHEAEDGHTHGGTHQLRTDDAGVVSVPLDGEGVHYLRTIHLVTSDEPGLTHESNWATLTFEVGHAHGDGLPHVHADGDGHDHEEGHDHDHDHAGVPSYVYWLGSLAIVGALFVYFNRPRA